MPMKTETAKSVGAARALLAPKTERSAGGRLSPEERKIHIAQVTEHELFVNQKRSEATLRDITCRAICTIKRTLRLPDAQADGRPAIPANWDEVFKPQLGSYLKFILGRPDQFRVHEGGRPGFYTVENVAGNTLAEPPSWLAKAKGKGKPFGKGKAAEEGKGLKGKGKGKNLVKGKGKASFPAAPWAATAAAGAGASRSAAAASSGGSTRGSGASAAGAPARALPRSAQLLARVAKEELAGLEGEEEAQADAESLGFQEDGFADGAGEEDAEADADPAGEEEEAAEEEYGEEDLAPYEEAEEADLDEPVAAPQRGSLISSFLGGGGGLKRKL